MRRVLRLVALTATCGLLPLVAVPGLPASPASGAVILPNTLEGWGLNSSGQLGNGTLTESLSPTVANLSGVVEFAAGDAFAVALLTNGTVVSWGDNTFGQLGDGTTGGQSSVPVTVSGLSNVRAVAAGGAHAMALEKNGAVEAWGDNTDGQLGDGTTGGVSNVPVPVLGFGGNTPVTGVQQIRAGENFSLAVVPYGAVWAWGDNTFGQLGNGSTTSSNLPVPVSGLTGGVRGVVAGSDFALALMGNETVDAWGDDSHGQLGNGSIGGQVDTPGQVSGVGGAPGGLTFVNGIDAGGAHSLAILPGGKVAAWGANGSGQLGNGTTADSSVPITIPNLFLVSSLAAGAQHTLALLHSGVVEAWGDNTYGQLGDGTTTQRDSPVPVPGLTGASRIKAGADFSLEKGQNLPPYITGRRVIHAFVGVHLTYTVVAHSHPMYAHLSEVGALPAGLTFTDNLNDTATLSGTPTGPPGNFTLELTATTGVGGTATRLIRISLRTLGR